jgi:hypothetical protein
MRARPGIQASLDITIFAPLAPINKVLGDHPILGVSQSLISQSV